MVLIVMVLIVEKGTLRFDRIYVIGNKSTTKIEINIGINTSI